MLHLFSSQRSADGKTLIFSRWSRIWESSQRCEASGSSFSKTLFALEMRSEFVLWASSTHIHWFNQVQKLRIRLLSERDFIAKNQTILLAV